MSKTDQLVSIVLVVAILIYLSVLAGAIIYHKASLFSLLNVAFAFSVIIYWVQKQFRISVHIADPMEISVLCFEISVIGLGIYSILSEQRISWLIITHKIVFTIHLSFLIVFLVFMLVFRISRLI